MKKIVALFFTFLISAVAIAQELPYYYVFLTYGNIWIQHSNQKNQIKPKQLVYLSDVIEIKDNHSELELVDKHGDFIVINAKGSYPVKNLGERINHKTEGLTKKYFELVWESISHSSSDFEIYKKETVAASWGGGSRGMDCDLEKFPSANICFSGDSLSFQWKNKVGNKNYLFELLDGDKNTIIEMLIRDTQMILLTRSLPSGEYYWKVKATMGACNTVRGNKFTLITKPQEKSLTDSIIKLIPLEKDVIFYNLKVSDELGKRGYIEDALIYFDKSWSYFKKN